MNKYRYLEHGQGYKLNKTLRSWRPQFPVILSLVKTGSKVLDIGCGDGALGKMLIEKKCQVYGLDLDLMGVKEAKKKGIKAVVLDVDETLPFKTGEFDLAINTEVLQFTKNTDFAVAETLRVAKTVIIAFPNFGFWFYRLQTLFGKFPRLSLYGHTWWNTSQIRFFSLADFLDLPSLKNVKIKKMVCIDWKNREVSLLAKFLPNLFARSCILLLQKTDR